MSALIQCAGIDVQRGRILLGARSTWWAALELAADSPPSGSVKIEAAGGLVLQGTVVKSGAFLLTAFVRVVGGAGGLSKPVCGAYQFAQLRDPLGEVMRASGETASGTIAAEVLAVPLQQFALGLATAAVCLDDLCTAASAYLGKVITWRVLGDGTVWLGEETWPSQAMPDDTVIADSFPAEGRTVLGCSTPSLLPGVALEGVGRVVGVDHWLEADAIRSWAWT